MTDTPTIGSLCTGYGGLDLAAETHYNAQTVWVAEIEPAPAHLLAHRFPAAPNLGDLTAVDWTTIAPVDILTAGYPCQPFSQAGHRKGTDDPRHIWPRIADAISALRPRHVVLENVAGHLTLGGTIVTGDLARLGYDARWMVVRASDVGACHRRARLFILAADAEFSSSGERHDPHEIRRRPAHPEQTRMGHSRPAPDTDGMGTTRRRQPGPADSEPTRRRPLGPVDAALTHSGPAPDPGGDRRDPRPRLCDGNAADDAGVEDRRRLTDNDRRQTVPDADGARPQRPLADAARHPAEPSSDPDADADGSRRGVVVGLESGMGPRRHPDGRGEDGNGPAWGDYGPAIARHADAMGRPAPSPVDDRGRLAPRFVEWMMMLPDGWVTDADLGFSRTQQLKMLGNGVVPPQARLALKLLSSTH